MLRILGTDEQVPVTACTRAELAGARLYRMPDGRWLGPAFRNRAVVLGTGELPDPGDEEAVAEFVLPWVQAVRAADWTPLHGAPLEADGDWIDLRTAMVRVGWGPAAAQAAWETCRRRPYGAALATAAGWAGGGWVVPAAADELDPAFARPVLESRGLLRWAYILRWQQEAGPPDDSPPHQIDPPGAWGDVVSRLRQDHYTEVALERAEALALAVLDRVGLGGDPDEDALPDAALAAACTHASPVVRAAAWFLLRAEADTWLPCAYAECQHHWAVEAEEDAFELDEVLELAGHGVANPVDAAYQRRRLLELAFGHIRDVPLVGAGDLTGFVTFYRDWVAEGRDEEEFAAAAAALRGDDGA